ncbi:hypothetical protein LOTGIDRAFT_158614 [Lottia gigantea]|uniref:Tyr recombinase domain-containing protein n=1 Tax=Lottia gigantea TaxID=225164 RepID=V4AWV5_LOTGI|nr:hypothetical protein LOTGIDRAFT_158614 [Lottia gigantea]ESO99525.1 hypothetical protein LOTGIDRAFT_158614 [Lottia gigantea]
MKITTDTRWYRKQSMGHNAIQKVIPELLKVAGVSEYKTNHSLRVTTATSLFNSGVPEQLIMERTGHRSVEGIRTYKRTSDDMKRGISGILNHADTINPTDTTDTKKEADNNSETPTKISRTSAPIIYATNCVINISK